MNIRPSRGTDGVISQIHHHLSRPCFARAHFLPRVFACPCLALVDLGTAKETRLFAIHREKVFGPGRAVRLDRNARARVLAFAHAWNAKHRQTGQHIGPITRTCWDVLRALLSFLGNRSGLCFPSYEALASRARCHRSSVAVALRVLEDAKVITWQHRLHKVRERVTDLFGVTYWRWRLLRTSNAYRFNDPKRAGNFPTGKELEDSSSYSSIPTVDPSSPLERALARFGAALTARIGIEQADCNDNRPTTAQGRG
jgi:helix-turn-helix protein